MWSKMDDDEGSCDGEVSKTMKRSSSQWAFDEFLKHAGFLQQQPSPIDDDDGEREIAGGAYESTWQPSLIDFSHMPAAAAIASNIESPSISGAASIYSSGLFGCGSGISGSPISRNVKPNINKNSENQGSGSSREQSDEDGLDLEIEAGPCEQSKDVMDIKSIRRKQSNRESARRSRRRKQAQLSDLESQVDQLKIENADLFKQFTDINHQYSNAATNNRILKSEVEALRAKVKMARDMVERGTSPSAMDFQASNTNYHMPCIDNNPLYNAGLMGVRQEAITSTTANNSNNVDDVCKINGAVERRVSVEQMVHKRMCGGTPSLLSMTLPWHLNGISAPKHG
ncbi:hypothetical protein AMTRI_Chr01g136690 [Amborella trichopoda]